MKMLVMILLISISGAAHDEVWEEDYGVSPPQGREPYFEIYRDYNYYWLFEKLFPETIRKDYPQESFKSFRVHLKDTNNRFPDPNHLKAENLKFVRRVQGFITYVSIIQKKYTYDVLKASDGSLVLNVRIHLKNATSEDMMAFTQKTQAAEKLWNSNAPSMNYKYRFKFDIVQDPNLSHFSVKVVDETRGPYDTYWGRDWVSTTIAHEIGHMMGLGDEYQTLSGRFDCYKPSLMCAAWTGSPMKHHYYFILRRLFN